MDKIRKEDHPYAVDIDTTPPGVNLNRIGDRQMKDTKDWDSRFTRFIYYLVDTPVRLFHGE